MYTEIHQQGLGKRQKPSRSYCRLEGKALSGVIVLAIMGAFYLATGFLIGVMLLERGESVAAMILFSVGVYLGGGMLASVYLLKQRNPIGRVLAWFVLPFTLISLPMAIFAGIALAGLYSRDMRDYLFGLEIEPAGPAPVQNRKRHTVSRSEDRGVICPGCSKSYRPRPGTSQIRCLVCGAEIRVR